MSKEVKEWSAKDGIFRMSKRNWMDGIKANEKAIKAYQEVESIKVPGDKFKALKGLYMMDRGERL